MESVRRRVSWEVCSLATRETRLHFVGTRVVGVSSSDEEPVVTEESGFRNCGKKQYAPTPVHATRPANKYLDRSVRRVTFFVAAVADDRNELVVVEERKRRGSMNSERRSEWYPCGTLGLL